MSNLPDGCTPQDIDDALEGFYDHCSACGEQVCLDDEACDHCGAVLDCYDDDDDGDDEE